MSQETNELLPAEWSASWQDGEPPRLDEAIRRTRARTRRQFLQVLIELGGALIGMAFLIRFAGANLHPADRPFGVLYAMAVAVLAWFAVHNTSGTWRPHDESPLAHARLHTLRAERRIDSARAAYVFLALSTLLYVPWILSRVPGPTEALGALGFLALIVSLYIFALRRSVRKARTERAAWSEACAQLEE
jgi:hypothetical protein